MGIYTCTTTPVHPMMIIFVDTIALHTGNTYVPPAIGQGYNNGGKKEIVGD